MTTPLLEHSATIADRHRFLHWPLAFPEVFCADDGTPLPDGGFDAVIGNPPWDMVRGDSGADESRRNRRTEARRLTGFVRESGVYHVETSAREPLSVVCRTGTAAGTAARGTNRAGVALRDGERRRRGAVAASSVRSGGGR